MTHAVADCRCTAARMTARLTCPLAASRIILFFAPDHPILRPRVGQDVRLSLRSALHGSRQ